MLLCGRAGGGSCILASGESLVLDERPRGRGAELTLRLAALIRGLCCATVRPRYLVWAPLRRVNSY